MSRTGAPAGSPIVGMSWNNRLRIAAGIAVTAVLLLAIVRRLDTARVIASVQELSAATLALAVLLLAGAYVAKIARWHVMLTSVSPDVTKAMAAQTLLAGVALNNVVPLRAGDVARVFAFREALGASASSLVPLLLLERLLDTAMLVILAAGVAIAMQFAGVPGAPPATLPATMAVPSALLPAGLAAILPLSVVALLGVAGLALAFGPMAGRLAWVRAGVVRRLPVGLRTPVTSGLDVFARQLRGRQGAALVALTALAWGLEGGMLAALCAGFGFTMPLLAGYFACALATLATLIPSAPGFFGTFHAAAIAAVQVFGAGPDAAAAFAFLAHAIMWLPLSVAGLLCLAALSAGKARTGDPAVLAAANERPTPAGHP